MLPKYRYADERKIVFLTVALPLAPHVRDIIHSYEEDSVFLDDHVTDDNWDATFEVVKLFVMNEGRWPRWEGKRTTER